MSYKPPASRMRTLRANKPPRPQGPPAPANVEEALAEAVEPEVVVAPEPEVVEPEVVEVAPEPIEEAEDPKVEVPEYGMLNRKAELLAIAESLGLDDANDGMTKAQIIELLDAATQ